MRRAAHEAVNKVVVHGVDGYLASEAVALAIGGLKDPSSWDSHLRRAAASQMLSCLYGERPVRPIFLRRIDHTHTLQG